MSRAEERFQIAAPMHHAQDESVFAFDLVHNHILTSR